MGGAVPKPLVKLGGKPLVEPIIRNALALPFAERIMVISEFTQAIRDTFDYDRLSYVEAEPKGTGYVVMEALKHVTSSHVVIAQADDSYFYRIHTLKKLMLQHEANKAVFTVGVVRTLEPLPYGSVGYDSSNKLLAIHKKLEDLDLPPPKDVVAGLYAGDVNWLRDKLGHVPVNSKGEIGLPTVIDLGLSAKEPIFVFHIPTDEWYGVNTPEELKEAEKRLSQFKA
jgi:NDP-sugar pyrophosphorylase family protein